MWVCDGKLIGVPTAGASVPNPSGQPSAGNIGLGFAIPVDLAKSVSDQLIATGSVTHSSFGVEAVTVSSAAAGEAGVDQGLYLSRVPPGGQPPVPVCARATSSPSWMISRLPTPTNWPPSR
jgi:putative serine protease PepD